MHYCAFKYGSFANSGYLLKIRKIYIKHKGPYSKYSDQAAQIAQAYQSLCGLCTTCLPPGGTNRILHRLKVKAKTHRLGLVIAFSKMISGPFSASISARVATHSVRVSTWFHQIIELLFITLNVHLMFGIKSFVCALFAHLTQTYQLQNADNRLRPIGTSVNYFQKARALFEIWLCGINAVWAN